MKQSYLKLKSIKDFETLNNQKSINLLTTSQPKIDKNKLFTAVLHLSPSDISGVDFCPNSNNCRKLCLFYSGNKLYHQAKFKARLRKSNMFNSDKFKFMHSILINICHLYAKNQYKPMNLRLNATSDIQFLDIPISVNLSLSNWLYNRYNIPIKTNKYQSIYHLFVENNLLIHAYDYTKILTPNKIYKSLDCKYHLTMSYDGKRQNETNIKACKLAIKHEINIAACFQHVKKSECFKPIYNLYNQDFETIDGDLSDERYLDAKNKIVCLRYKRDQHHKNLSKKDINAFCYD
tara:strand:+ start:1439 stop:2311 length:873 start_codon:yes stop_codon:yes gene_type:complete